MKVLFTIQQFETLSGAQIVALEICEYFISRGHSCDLVSNIDGPPIRSLARKAGIRLLSDPTEINAFEYDLVCIMHHLGPALKFVASAMMKERTFFAFLHTSNGGNLAPPGLVLQPLIADRILVNSPETAHFLQECGQPGATEFYNAAPQKFWDLRRKASELRVVTLVSNHAPDEAVAALKLLNGIEVKRFGKGAQIQRVTPGNLRRADVVVTIGKTVQYALALGLTPYVYDWHGGPGYLSAENFAAAKWHNFSGRCCRRKLTARQIADEITTQFEAAQKFASTLPSEELKAFRLEHYLDDLLAAVQTAEPNVARLARMASHAGRLRTERGIAIALGAYYRQWRRLRRRAQASE